MRKTVLAFALIFLSACADARANHLVFSNVTVASQNTSAGTVTVRFDLSWENSWRDSTNFDAAWIFMKYSLDGGTTWRHATMKSAGTNPAGFSPGSGTEAELVVPSDRKGCFLQRASAGAGTFSASSAQVVWNYAADGVDDSSAVSQETLYRLFGVEMVYVPPAGFYAGDGTPGTDAQLQWEAGSPGTINSESAGLSFESSAGAANAWYYESDPGGNDDDATGTVFSVSSSFPKGAGAFYAMKYEISEGQWVGFFNTLTSAQKAERDITSTSGKNSDLGVYRNSVAWTSGDATTVRPDRACGYLSWMDLAAYLDWAALRPMTELEYEKTCRGPLSPVMGEYAWGTTTISSATTISGFEDGTETVVTSGANANFNDTIFSGGDAGSGPLRAGVFATAATNTRTASGAGFYGVLDLSGNLWERTVTIGNAAGRSFSGSHGDGVLTSVSGYEGNATNSDWPGIDGTSTSRGVTGALGSGFRGGSWDVAAANAVRLSVSDRYKAATADTSRGRDYGGRGVRTA